LKNAVTLTTATRGRRSSFSINSRANVAPSPNGNARLNADSLVRRSNARSSCGGRPNCICDDPKKSTSARRTLSTDDPMSFHTIA
jgi:hypothetical protein